MVERAALGPKTNGSPFHEASKVLVAGAVQHIGRLRGEVRVERVNWSALRQGATGAEVALVVLGAAPAQVDPLALIAELKGDRDASPVPVLHLAHGVPCIRCDADVCLSAEAPIRTLIGVVRSLSSLGRLRRGMAAASSARLEPVPTRSGDIDERLEALVQAAPGVVFRYDLETRRVRFVSASVELLLGYTPERLAAMSPTSARGLVHPEDRPRLTGQLAQCLAAGERRVYEVECRLKAASGDWRAVRSRLVPTRSEEGGREIVGIALDVSELREHRKLLERAQRLDALGRIAGGIAHDFNNALGVITGHAQLAQRLLPADHPARAGLEQVVKASERAAALPQKLLALGREPSRQPRSIEVNRAVAEIGDMLQRVIAEDVEVDLRLGADVGLIRGEPAQLEQMLLNLAVNARDAMPRGGRFSVETARRELTAEEAAPVGVPPGRYVVLIVSDNGTGMDVETRRRMFEPFFTTKPEGAGSGLGLAIVQDEVRRCGGAIAVESAPGAGTTFRIYLPAHDPEPRASGVEERILAAPEGSETVLLVEDAEPIRDVTRVLLEGLGYTVLSAAHGSQAIDLARSYPGPIHVLLTDLVMPKLDGGSVAAEVVSLRPETRVLYMSGYSSDALPAHGRNGGTVMLSKPFTRDRLANAVRQTIDRKTKRELG